jgi:hypothetical protein
MMMLQTMLFALATATQTPPDTGVTILRAGRVFDGERGVMMGAQDIRVRSPRTRA